MTIPADDYLTPAEAAGFTKCALRTLQDFRLKGGGPPYVRVGTKKVIYPRAGLVAWMQARTFASTSEEAAQRGAKAAA